MLQAPFTHHTSSFSLFLFMSLECARVKSSSFSVVFYNPYRMHLSANPRLQAESSNRGTHLRQAHSLRWLLYHEALGLAIKRPDYEQALLVCLGELGKLAIGT